MENKIFRKSSLERISSPEQLNDYIRISKPGIWLILAALLALTLSLFIWGTLGNIPSAYTIKGEAKGGKIICYVSPEDAAGLTAGMEALSGGTRGTIESISEVPLSYAEAAAKCENDYMVYALGISEWNVKLTIDADVPDGLREITIISDNVKPISFLTN